MNGLHVAAQTWMTTFDAPMLSSAEQAPQAFVQQCPCCGTPTDNAYPALIAPFIRALVNPAHSSMVSLLQCRSCGHRFFSYQYTEDDLGRLYSGYRGERYFHTRHRLEPWYGRNTNSANLNPSLIRARRESLLTFLSPLLSPKQNGLVVADLGGDAGQFLPLELASNAYLIETSDQKPVAGVVRVNTLAEVPHDLDLLICAHVLEHLPHPTSFLHSHLASARIASGCLIYLEVPLERYDIAKQLQSKLYRQYLRLLIRFQPAVIVMDFLSVLARGYLGKVFPPLILKMHEHVNFYTIDSLTACIRSAGLELIAIKQDQESSIATHQGVIRALARRV